MSRKCEVCGKSAQVGNKVETRGKAKYLGGVGTKITGITRRQFRPNLQRVRVMQESGQVKRVWVSVKALKAGKVQKAPRTMVFQLFVFTMSRSK